MFQGLATAEELRECREQEYKDQSGRCIACRQCDAGQELSKVCKLYCCALQSSNSVTHWVVCGSNAKLMLTCAVVGH